MHAQTLCNSACACIIQEQAVMEVNQFTTLAISLLVILCLLIGGAVLTAVLL